MTDTCPATITYGETVITCSMTYGHGGGLHGTDTVVWPRREFRPDPLAAARQARDGA